MKIELEPGEEVHVNFKGTDGDITVAYEEVRIVVAADLADTSGRKGVIYEERFGHDLDENGLKKVGPAKVRILRSAASGQELVLAETMPDRYEIVDDPVEP